MRTISVDTKGLLFTLKAVLLLTLVGTGWYAWEPLSTLLLEEDGEQTAAVVDVASPPAVAPSFEFPVASTLSGRYVVIDVYAMRVTLYESTNRVDEFPIERLPAGDSPDALVPGTFTVDAVADEELSTVTLVRYPTYVRFGGRYALHGPPTDQNGALLEDAYAGSSVLLSHADARAVAAFARDGMIVYVEAPTPKTTPPTPSPSVTSDERPGTSASAYILRDMESGATYLARGNTERYPIASITKLVTAVVASEVIGHGEEILAPNGERYTLGDLFYPLLLRSDNAVAERIATHAGTETFLAHMNTYVRAHGMHDSVFADSSGLSPKNVSTADDLAALAHHLYTDKTYLLAMTAEADMIITSSEGNERLIINQNNLADDPHFRGGKLGYTDEAEQTSLAVFNVPVGGETRPVAVIVLGSKDWKQDTRTLLRWLVNATAE